MNHHTFKFSNKERRLIYEKPAQQSEFKSINEAVVAIEKNSTDKLAKAALENAVSTSKTDASVSSKMLEGFQNTKRTKGQLDALRKILSVHGIKLAVDKKTGTQVENVTFAEVVPATPGENKPKGPVLKTDAKGNVTGLSDKAKKDIESAGSRLGQTIKSFIEALMPLIKSLQKIVNDLKQMIQEIVDDFKFDGSKLATTDKFIDKQIDDPEADPKFIQKHFANAQAEKNKIDTELSGIPGDNVAEKQGNLQEKIKNGQEDVNAMNKKISAAPDAETETKLTKDRDFALRKVQKLQSQLNGISAKIERRAVLEARLERIKAVAAARNIVLTGAVAASVGNPQSAPSSLPTSAKDEEREKASAEAKKTPLQNAEKAMDEIENALVFEEPTEIRVAEKIAALNVSLAAMEEKDRVIFFSQEEIYDVKDTEKLHKVMSMEDGTEFEVTQSKGKLSFTKKIENTPEAVMAKLKEDAEAEIEKADAMIAKHEKDGSVAKGDIDLQVTSLQERQADVVTNLNTDEKALGDLSSEIEDRLEVLRGYSEKLKGKE